MELQEVIKVLSDIKEILLIIFGVNLTTALLTTINFFINRSTENDKRIERKYKKKYKINEDNIIDE